MIVSTNARFLEEDYMIHNKPRKKIFLEELRGEDDNNLVSLIEVNPSPITSTEERGEPRRSGRVVHQP